MPTPVHRADAPAPARVKRSRDPEYKNFTVRLHKSEVAKLTYALKLTPHRGHAEWLRGYLLELADQVIADSGHPLPVPAPSSSDPK